MKSQLIYIFTKLSSASAPQLQGFVKSTGHNAILEQINPHHLAFMALHGCQHSPVSRRPDLGRAIKGTGCQKFTVLVAIKSKLRHEIGMRGNGGKLLALAKVPHFDKAIVTRSGKLKAVGTKLGTKHSFRMPQEMMNRFSSSQIPQLDHTSKVSGRA